MSAGALSSDVPPADPECKTGRVAQRSHGQTRQAGRRTRQFDETAQDSAQPQTECEGPRGSHIPRQTDQESTRAHRYSQRANERGGGGGGVEARCGRLLCEGGFRPSVAAGGLRSVSRARRRNIFCALFLSALCAMRARPACSAPPSSPPLSKYSPPPLPSSPSSLRTVTVPQNPR